METVHSPIFNILVSSDQWGFIIEHPVIERQAEVLLSIPLADRYCALGVLAANLHKLGNVLQEKARKKHEKLRKAA